jgi:hypothetical protein
MKWSDTGYVCLSCGMALENENADCSCEGFTDEDDPMTTADVRDLARESIEELVKHFDETDPYMFCVEYHIADAILAALAAKGLTICGPGQVAVSRADVFIATTWLHPGSPRLPDDEVRDRLRAALSAGVGQDGEHMTGDKQ